MRSFILSICLIIGYSVATAQQFPNPIHIPDTLNGPVYDLTVLKSKTAFISGDSTNTYGINGSYLGPTLIMHENDTVQMHVTNLLGETTTMHWHGMHVAPEDDGGPHTSILADSTWSPSFPVMDQATTFWYHPHLHHKTAEQVYSGAAGMIIVRDDKAVGNLLPHTYGVDEFPLIIQDKSFDANNKLIYTAMADTMMVNGTLGGYLEVPAQMVRFHILNASNQRVYNLGFLAQFQAWQIGSDGGFLESPLPLNKLQLTPGERVEVVIDFSQHISQNIKMKAFNSELGEGLSGGPRGPRGGPNNQLDSLDFDIMEFRVIAATNNAITTRPPITLNTFDKPLEANADRHRTKTFTVDSTGFPFYINGSLMDINVINDTVQLDDIEIWTLINSTDVAHPWHIHDIQFYILDINGNPPPPHLSGRKDVIIVQPFDTIRYITQFDDFVSDSIPYMFHCHNLFHEDGGMMGQFLVLNLTSINEVSKDKLANFEVYPNPSSGDFYLKKKIGAINEIERIEVFDISGRSVQVHFEILVNQIEIKMEDQAKGAYFLKIYDFDGSIELVKLVRK